MAMVSDTNIPMTADATGTDGLGGRIVAFFAALRAGQAAAVEFDRLQNRSDADLARHGMNRADAVRAVMDRHFG